MSINTFAKSAESLLSFEFVALSAISFLAFCNLSLFYGFNAYLEGIGVPATWRGVLIGLLAGAVITWSLVRMLGATQRSAEK